MARKTIVALYDTQAQAEAAWQALRDDSVSDSNLEVITAGGYGAASGHGDLQPNLLGWGVPRAEADAYASAVQKGGALLVASFTDSASVERAADLLRNGHPLDDAMAGTGLSGAATAMRQANVEPGPRPLSTPVEPEPQRVPPRE